MRVAKLLTLLFVMIQFNIMFCYFMGKVQIIGKKCKLFDPEECFDPNDCFNMAYKKFNKTNSEFIVMEFNLDACGSNAPNTTINAVILSLNNMCEFFRGPDVCETIQDCLQLICKYQMDGYPTIRGS